MSHLGQIMALTLALVLVLALLVLALALVLVLALLVLALALACLSCGWRMAVSRARVEFCKTIHAEKGVG